MHNRYLMSLVAAPLMIAALAMPAFADSTPTTCKDGSTSEVSGRGACSGHGGVLKIKKVKASKEAAAPAAAAAAPAAAAPAAAAPAAAATVAAPAAKVEKAATKTAEAKAPTVTASATDPTGATAKCKDGTFSHSKHHGGSCSNHGGVAEFLAK